MHQQSWQKVTFFLYKNYCYIGTLSGKLKIFPEASQKYLNNLEILNTVTEIDARNKVTLKCNIKPSWSRMEWSLPQKCTYI